MPLGRLYVAMVGHVEVPVRMLIAAAVLLALIGGLGLGSMMAVNVIERTRALYVDAYERITGEPFTAWLERSA